MKSRIGIAQTDQEILATYNVMHQLRPKLKKSEYISRVRLQERVVGFQLAALSEGSSILCVAGFRICHSLGWGKFLYVDDLVTDQHHRSKGAGRKMFHWLVRRARKEDCDELRLDSALWRHGAHRFYLHERMDIACFHFRLELRKSHATSESNGQDLPYGEK